MSLPTDSSHLSDQPSAELIEQFTGTVETQFTKDSIMRQYADVRPVKGTDTLINRRLGRTTLKKVTAGVRPDAASTPQGRTSVTVDTIILARDNQALLNDFQSDFNVRAAIGEDHGKEMAKFFDEAFIIQGIKGSLAAAPSGLNGAIGAGKNVELAAANDELDADKVEEAIATIVTEMREEDIDVENSIIFVRPTTYRVLSKHGKLVNMDYSGGNGDFSKTSVQTVAGVRVVSTARIPNAAITNHKLSNAANNFAYDVSAAEADAIAVILHPKSLLAGETIPLMSDVHYDKVELQWFIDSMMAFAVAVNRPDCCGAVFKYRA